MEKPLASAGEEEPKLPCGEPNPPLNSPPSMADPQRSCALRRKNRFRRQASCNTKKKVKVGKKKEKKKVRERWRTCNMNKRTNNASQRRIPPF